MRFYFTTTLAAIIALLLYAIFPSSPAAAAHPIGAYQYFAVSKDLGREIESSGMKRIGPGLMAGETSQEIPWSAFAQRMPWPFKGIDGGAADAIFTMTGESVPPTASMMSLRVEGESAVGQTRCRVFSLSIHGGSDEEESFPGVSRRVSLEGKGRALMCPGESLPRALHYEIERRVAPALWEMRSKDEANVSRIDAAWAAMP